MVVVIVYYHMRGKITESWLAETKDMITWCWLSHFAICVNDLMIEI